MSKNVWGDYVLLTNHRHNLQHLPEFWWEIRPVTVKDEIEVEREFGRRTFLDPDPNDPERTLYSPPTQMDTAVVEISACFAECKMPPSVHGITPPTAGAKFADVMTYVEDLPYPVVREIWEQVGVVNPTWGPRKPKKADGTGEADATNVPESAEKT